MEGDGSACSFIEVTAGWRGQTDALLADTAHSINGNAHGVVICISGATGRAEGPVTIVVADTWLGSVEIRSTHSIACAHIWIEQVQDLRSQIGQLDT